MIKTTAAESGTVTTVNRSTTKAITCPACGQLNLIKSKHYYWLLSKEKQARCRHCGRSFRL
ncbi:MAG: hypothetical protein ACFFDU_10820 [Candidatus Thorarchaeota archaeon]